MFNSTYGAGFRAAMADTRFIPVGDGTKIIESPECPFPARRFISRMLWNEGLHAGTIKKLSGSEPVMPLIMRIDLLGIAFFLVLFILFKVL